MMEGVRKREAWTQSFRYVVMDNLTIYRFDHNWYDRSMSQLGVRGVHHVSINVHDAEAARRFYVGVLGFVERTDRPEFPFDGAWLDVGPGGQQLHLLEVEGVAAPAGQHFAVGVDDLDAAIAAINACGVEVSAPTHVGEVARQAFLKDPTGNLVELNQSL